MSQATIDLTASTDTGTSLVTALELWRDALHSSHRGGSQPSYRVAGMCWLDDSADPTWVWKIYDGTDWITIGTIDATANTFTSLDIAGLTLLTATALASGDSIPIYDASASAHKRVTYDAFFASLNNLTQLSAPDLADKVGLRDESGGVGRYITLEDLLKVVNTLTEDTTPDTSNDFVLTYDASAGAAKKVKPSNLGGGCDIVATPTASGASVAQTGIGSYKAFLIQLVGVSHDSGTSQSIRVEISNDNGSTYGTAIPITAVQAAGVAFYAHAMISHANTTANKRVSSPSAANNGGGGTEAVKTGTINALRFSPSGGNLDAGEIVILGFK